MKSHFTRLLLSGGGTGGHLSPLVALIDQIQQQHKGYNLSFIGSVDGREATVIPDLGVSYFPITTSKLRRYFSFRNLVDLCKLPFSLWQTLWLFLKIKPDIVVISGGYVAFPVALMSAFLRVPLVVHEQTLQAGLVNRIAGRFAVKIALSFAESKQYFPPGKCVVVGNPIRSELLDTAPLEIRDFTFDNDLPTLYVTGSYQGALFINRLVGKHLPSLLTKMNIVHQCGCNEETGDFLWLQEKVQELDEVLQQRYQLVKTVTVSQLHEIYHHSTVVLSRSGATTVAELATLGKVAVLIPYPYAAGGEQLQLARMLEGVGAAGVFEQHEIVGDEQKFVDAVFGLVSNEKKREEMSRHIKQFGHHDATEKLVEVVNGVFR